MSQREHQTLPPCNEQLQAVIHEGWEQEGLPQLPTDSEQQAEQLKAFVRQREIKQVADLLRALLAYVLCAPSFRQLGAWAVLVGLVNISHVAWCKRLRQAHAWLLWLLCELLAVTVPPSRSQESRVHRVLLIDATRLKEPGGSGDDWRVHLGYDLLGDGYSGCAWPIGTPPKPSSCSSSVPVICGGRPRLQSLPTVGLRPQAGRRGGGALGRPASASPR